MKSFKDFLQLDEAMRWGKAGAGLIVHCGKNFLWTQRSIYVMEPMTWSLTIGGKVDDSDSNLVEAAKREFLEETSYRGTLKVSTSPFYVHSEEGFTYSSFLAEVKEEFELPPYSNKREQGQWEIYDWSWEPSSAKFPSVHPGTKPIIAKLKQAKDFK
jgi:8-oxo-dGTP pyrophosphatase MutT (NUDIX family)